MSSSDNRKSADVNARDSNFRTQLMNCADAGNLYGVHCLLEEPGCDVNLQDKFGNTAFVLALKNARSAAANALLTRKCDLMLTNWAGETVWHLGVQYGEMQIVRAMIKLGKQNPYWNINVPNRQSRTALHYAMESKCIDLVHILLKHGADWSLKDGAGLIPVQLAGGSISLAMFDRRQIRLPQLNIIQDLEVYNTSKPKASDYHLKFRDICRQHDTFQQIYTDGSVKGRMAASAAWSPAGAELSLRLPDRTESNTAELRALLLALEIAEQSNRDKFIIFTDCLSIIQSLRRPDGRHPYLCEIYRRLGSLMDRRQVVFCWVPAHIGIPGNEVADGLAKQALTLPVQENYVA